MKLTKKKYIYLITGTIAAAGLVAGVAVACRNVKTTSVVQDVVFSEVDKTTAKVSINFLNEINPNTRVSVKLNDKVYAATVTSKTKSVLIPLTGLDPKVEYTVVEVKVDGRNATLNANIKNKKIAKRDGTSPDKPGVDTEIKVSTVEVSDIKEESAKVKVTLSKDVAARSNVVLTLKAGEKTVKSEKTIASALKEISFDFNKLEANTEYTVESLTVEGKAVSLSGVTDQKTLKFKTLEKKATPDQGEKEAYDFSKVDETKVTVTYKNASETLYSAATTDATNYDITLDTSLSADLTASFLKAEKTEDKITVTYKLVGKTKTGEKEFTKEILKSVFKSEGDANKDPFDLANEKLTVSYENADKVTFDEATPDEETIKFTFDSTITGFTAEFILAEKEDNKIIVSYELVKDSTRKEYKKEINASSFKQSSSTTTNFEELNNEVIVEYKDPSYVTFEEAGTAEERYILESGFEGVTLEFVKAEKNSDKITVTYKIKDGNNTSAKDFTKYIAKSVFKTVNVSSNSSTQPNGMQNGGQTQGGTGGPQNTNSSQGTASAGANQAGQSEAGSAQTDGTTMSPPASGSQPGQTGTQGSKESTESQQPSTSQNSGSSASSSTTTSSTTAPTPSTTTTGSSGGSQQP
ncbi:Vmc-like lipoprotein signal peptide domain-containing protein [Ureaplasma canigenitalium]|uniref:Vmc-like lipoprotein signal peptide domain-containing protein n=1 Tax=Ureaplasma canigenitalium TaxID=42092 RepID=UPI0004E10D8E|nr:hypothetical protein [Ureaplasma canigenitalium]